MSALDDLRDKLGLEDNEYYRKKALELEGQKTKNNKKENNNFLNFKSSYFNDGYQFGDVSKTIGTTGINALNLLGKSTLKAVENIAVDTPMALTGLVLSKLDALDGKVDKQENLDKLKKIISTDLVDKYITKESNEKYKEGLSSLEDASLVKKDNIAGQIVQGIGGMVPSILTGGSDKIGKVSSYLTLGARSFGSASEEALANGAQIDEATLYGILNTAVEIGSEMVTGGIPGTNTNGWLDKLTDKEISKISSKIVKKIAKSGYSFVGEASEEALAEILNPIIKNMSYTEGETIDWNAVVESAIVGGLTGQILNAPSDFSSQTIDNYSGQIISNNNQITNVNEQSNNNQIGSNNQQNTNNITENITTEVNKVETQIANNEISQELATKSLSELKNDLNILKTWQESQKVKETNAINKEQVKVIDDLVNKVENLEKQVSGKEVKLPTTTNQDNINLPINTNQINIQNQELDNSSFNLKQNQLEIIQKNNSMTDDYHVGIRNVNDIKTWEEVLQLDDDIEGQFAWGDYTRDDAEQALKEGKIKIYSGDPIKQGSFVSTSYIQAEEYAGGRGNKVYEKIVPLNEVAWINGDEGQYAKVNNIPIKQTKGNIPINKDLLNKYNSVKEIFNNESNNYDGNVKVKNDIIELHGVDIDNLSSNETKKYAKEIFKKYNSTNVFINNNNKITVTLGGIEESINKIFASKTQRNLLKEHLLVFSDLGDIIEHATLVNQNREIKDRNNINLWNYYFDGLTINDKKYSLEFDVRSMQDGTNQYRVQRLEQKKSISQLGASVNNTNTDRAFETSITDNIIANNNENVKLPPAISNNSMQNNENNTIKLPKTENPLEISKLTKEDANTTPLLPKRTYQKGDGESSFYSNITEKSKFLNKDLREMMKDEENIQYYQEITNKDTLEKAYEKLQEGGMEETAKWFNKDVEKGSISEVDVAEGWILLKQYQDAKDYQSAVEVAKKMRDIGTKAGQTVQAFNIMNRLTPEGMVYYAQSELSEAYNKMVKNKTKKWIDQNINKFDLNPNEVKFIMDTMNEVKDMQDGYEKRVKLAEIQKVLTDKLPPENGAGIKAWMRISMLFNPKTQVRNVMGNAIIAPVNYFSDMFSSAVDKQIAKKTGIRTTGTTKLGTYLKGGKKGLYESYNDFKKGINTRNMQGNRFEVTEGKSFNDNNIIGKKLNQVDNLLSFALDAGDRFFYEATFTNSINNQLELNNTTEVTPEMLDIATNEALQRTWQDNNEYTKAVLGIRRLLNKANVKGYGLGDVLIPFAKTPANLTKAIVDYSPAGLLKTLAVDAKNLKNSLENGQYTPQLQHKFVQNLGKGFAGSFLYILGYALANAGIISGENDEDKDVSNFMKNSLGMNSYSIKVGNKSFSYDWAQPIAAPFAIMANYTKQSKENPDATMLDKGINVLNSGFDVLLEQSFMNTINDVLNGNGTTVENLENAILELPSRAVPTFLKQIADMVDPVTRTSFEYDKPLKSAMNKVVAKVPFLSKTLEPSVDTLGNEIQKYGGKNNLFNVFLNPSNINKGELTVAGEEIYRLYQKTGDATIMPRVAPYYINTNGEKIILTNKEKTEFQKISGNIIEENIKALLNDFNYQNMSDIDKASVVNELVNYSYNKARKDVLGLEMSQTYNRINKFIAVGGTPAQFYATKDTIASFKGDNKKNNIINYINSQPMTIEQKAQLIRMEYPSYTSYNSNIVNYINSQNMTIAEKIEILELLGFEIRNGKVYW